MRQLRAADVVYVSTPQPTQILLSVFAAVVAGAPLVIEVRDLWPVFLRRLRMINSRFTSAILAWLEALGCRLSARCIAVSPGFTDYLERIGVQRERLAVIPSGADAAIVSKADIDQRNIENFSTEQPFTVLYAGSLNDPYAIDTLLAAARGLESRSDIQWVFAGNGRSRLNVEAAAQRETNIRFIPAIPRDEVISLYQQADVGIVSLANEPTLSSVIPGKLIDYLAAGVPVISVVDGVHGEMVRQSRAGIVLKEPTAAALVEAISNLAAMPATQRSAMRSAGQEWVMTHLPASRLARSVSRIVRDAHNDAPRRLNGLVATWAAIDAAVDVITMRSYRASQGLTSPDAAMLAAQSLRDWLTDSNTTADMNTSAELRIPRLLSSLADVTLPPLEQSSGQGVDLCR